MPIATSVAEADGRCFGGHVSVNTASMKISFDPGFCVVLPVLWTMPSMKQTLSSTPLPGS